MLPCPRVPAQNKAEDRTRNLYSDALMESLRLKWQGVKGESTENSRELHTATRLSLCQTTQLCWYGKCVCVCVCFTVEGDCVYEGEEGEVSEWQVFSNIILGYIIIIIFARTRDLYKRKMLSTHHHIMKGYLLSLSVCIATVIEQWLRYTKAPYQIHYVTSSLYFSRPFYRVFTRHPTCCPQLLYGAHMVYTHLSVIWDYMGLENNIKMWIKCLTVITKSVKK